MFAKGSFDFKLKEVLIYTFEHDLLQSLNFNVAMKFIEAMSVTFCYDKIFFLLLFYLREKIIIFDSHSIKILSNMKTLFLKQASKI